MTFREWFNRKLEALAIAISWHLLPRRVVYWSFIRVATGNGKGGPYPGNPGERTINDAADAFMNPTP